MKQTILTGIRSNEEPTLGNFLGAFLPMVNLQKEYSSQYNINMFVPDLHSFTTPIDHGQLYNNTIKNLRYFVASGLDITDDNLFLYRQSFIPAHSELTWILDCFTYVGEMQRMIQFKDKSAENSASVTMGLMNYPVLMASDILLYGAKWVPVGEDQFQHLEITRDIAMRFNNKFGEVFTVPEPTKNQTQFIKRDQGLRVRSLTNPSKKMSKSSSDEKSKINISDSPLVASKKIMAATTDNLGVINFDWNSQPGITNLLQILAFCSKTSLSEVTHQWAGKTSYGEFKQAVAVAVGQFLTDFQDRLNKVDDNLLLQKLESSEQAMSKVATNTLLKVQKAVGLRK